MSGLTIRRESSLQDIDWLEWNGLLDSMQEPLVFMSPEYCDACWASYQKDCELILLTCWQEDQMVGVAPFMLVPNSRGGGVRLITSYRGDYSDLVCKDGSAVVARALLLAVWEASAGHSVWLDSIPESSNSLEMIKKLRHEKRCYPIKRATNPSSSLVYDGNESRATRMKSLKPQRNYFLNLGDYQVRHLLNPAEIHPLLDAFFEQHVTRWSGSESPSLFRFEENREIYRRLVDTLGPRGWLLFSVVEGGGSVLAYHFGFQFNHKLIYYKPTYNVAWATRSPGMILLKELFLYTFEKDFDEFDFSVGDDGYKGRFTNSNKQNFTYELSSNRYQWIKYLMRAHSPFLARIIGSLEAIKLVGLYAYIVNKLSIGKR
ncbi:MAG: CelD/BcsL family acetyltransferase involved in cellulose biosynthesis [Parasphingorhabdus sp.]|jgi:CelD/BcsL family acetyltransferase involved in cellulose biosynthesis